MFVFFELEKKTPERQEPKQQVEEPEFEDELEEELFVTMTNLFSGYRTNARRTMLLG